MKRITKSAAIVLSCAVLSVLVAYLVVALSWDRNLCAEDELSRAVALDGKFVAVAYERNCGATTRVVSHVNLRRSEDDFAKTNVGTVVDGEVLTLDGASTIALSWPDPKTVRIRYSGGARMVRQESSWSDVRIVVE